MIPSSLSQAKADPRLRGAPLAVYVWCLEHLDFVDEREVKVAAVAHELHLRDDTTFLALRTLAHCGYLHRGGRRARGLRRYRLLASPVKRMAA